MINFQSLIYLTVQKHLAQMIALLHEILLHLASVTLIILGLLLFIGYLFLDCLLIST